MQELVRRVSQALNETWWKKTGRPRMCGPYAAGAVRAGPRGGDPARGGQGVPGRRHDHPVLVLRRAPRTVEPETRHHRVLCPGDQPAGLPIRFPAAPMTRRHTTPPPPPKSSRKPPPASPTRVTRAPTCTRRPRNRNGANSTRAKNKPTPRSPHFEHRSNEPLPTSRTGESCTPTIAARTPLPRSLRYRPRIVLLLNQLGFRISLGVVRSAKALEPRTAARPGWPESRLAGRGFGSGSVGSRDHRSDHGSRLPEVVDC